jgi:hypothetical protein
MNPAPFRLSQNTLRPYFWFSLAFLSPQDHSWDLRWTPMRLARRNVNQRQTIFTNCRSQENFQRVGGYISFSVTLAFLSAQKVLSTMFSEYTCSVYSHPGESFTLFTRLPEIFSWSIIQLRGSLIWFSGIISLPTSSPCPFCVRAIPQGDGQD